MADHIIQRIEAFPFSRGAIQVERRNRGYSIYHAASGAPLARLRSDPAGEHFEVLYWSLGKDGWASTGPFGRTVLPLEQPCDSSLPRTSSGRCSDINPE